MTIQQRYQYVIDHFSQHQPNPASELRYENAFQLLVAVILSAQCTDKRVNSVAPHLFEQDPTPLHLKNSTVEQIYHIMRSVSYPNSKAKYLQQMAGVLVEEFDGIVPDSTEKLQQLPGVGRKTANVLTAVIFNQPNMAVDTHVFRVSNRIGLVINAKNPLQTEKQLTKYLPKSIIPKAHHWLILHGRYTCLARKPKCSQCPIKNACNFYANMLLNEKNKDKNTVINH